LHPRALWLASLRAGKTYGKPIFGVGFDLIKNLWENL
jgi:hypothetical protein